MEKRTVVWLAASYLKSPPNDPAARVHHQAGKVQSQPLDGKNEAGGNTYLVDRLL